MVKRLPVLVGSAPPADELAEPGDGLDCLVVGHNDLDFHDLCLRAKETEGHSAYYADVKMHAVLLGGRRIQYIDLFNLAAARALGRDPRLNPFRQPSAAVCHLVSHLRKRGLRAEMVNFPVGERDRFAALLDEKPGAVAITTTYYVEADPIVDLVRFIRERSPDSKIVLGGPYIYRLFCSHDEPTQEYLLDGLGADFYIHDAQGEATLTRLVRALRRGDDPAGVPNLVWSEDGEAFRRSPRQAENNDMNGDAVDWTLFDQATLGPTVYMRTARSCPFTCSFCTYPSSAGDHVLADVEVVAQQLVALRERGVENVVFVDDTLNVPLPRFKALLRRMIELDLGLRWMSFFRCSNADDETFALMRKSGCLISFLGIESGDQAVLQNMDKFAKLDRYEYGIRGLRDQGILTHASLIVGFPGETAKTVDNTIRFIERTRPDFFAPQIFYHDRRSPLEARKQEFGLAGSGFHWSHATADWRDAIVWTRRMLEGIETSEVLGGYSLGCWGAFYLLTRGYSLEQLRGFLRLTRVMMLEGLDEREASRFDDLVALLRPEPALTASP